MRYDLAGGVLGFVVLGRIFANLLAWVPRRSDV